MRPLRRLLPWGLFTVTGFAFSVSCSDSSSSGSSSAAGAAGNAAAGAGSGGTSATSGGEATLAGMAGLVGKAGSTQPEAGGQGGEARGGETSEVGGGAGGAEGGSGGATSAAASRVANTYEIFEISGAWGNIANTGINDSGVVVGRYRSSNSTGASYMWTMGDGMTVLSPENGYSVTGRINSAGVLVAHEGASAMTRLGFSTLTGKYAALPLPPGYTHFVPEDINDDNVIVGGTTEPSVRGFVLTKGVYQMLDLYPKGTSSYAQAINASGEVVGWVDDDKGKFIAARFDGATPSLLGTLGGDYSTAYDVNASGAIVGQSKTVVGDYHAFFLGDAGMKDLGVLAGKSASAYALNDGGIVVGYSSTASANAAIAWTLDDGLVDLNQRLGGATGWVLTEADDINTSGAIVGTGTHNGVAAAFVLVPQP